jgi:hypothetical protein
VHLVHSSPSPEQKKAEVKKDFDPQSFAARLQFTQQVEQLGFTEAAAKDFSIGFYRGQVYIPIRHADGTIGGFVGYADGVLKLAEMAPRSFQRGYISKEECVKKSPAIEAGLSLIC